MVGEGGQKSPKKVLTYINGRPLNNHLIRVIIGENVFERNETIKCDGHSPQVRRHENEIVM